MTSYSICFQVPLGVLPKNENKIEDMVCIMEHLHQYVQTLRKEHRVQVSPTSEEDVIQEHKFYQVLLGGDQLTVARARSCQLGRGNSDSALSKLTGLIPVAEDWHTGVVLLVVSYKNNQWELFPTFYFLCRLCGSACISLTLYVRGVHFTS